MVKYIIPFLFLILISCANNGSDSDTHQAPAWGPEPQQEVIQYADANKIGKEDNEMCWAAAGSNMAAYKENDDEDSIMNEFRQHWENRVGWVFKGLIWYYREYQDTEIGHNIILYIDNMEENLPEILAAGGIVSAQIEIRDDALHFINIWEYKDGVIWYTDSNDGPGKRLRFADFSDFTFTRLIVLWS